MIIQVVPLLIVAAVFTSITNTAYGANVLTVFPLGTRSHWFAIKPLFVELTNRGHNITLVTAVLENDYPSSWEIIHVPDPMTIAFESSNTIKEMTELKGWATIQHLTDFGPIVCDNFFQHGAVQKLIKTEERKFDVFVMEYIHHNCILALAHRLNTSVIGVSSFGGVVWTTDTVGNPFQASYVPETFLDLTDHMTFFQRLKNFATILYARYRYHHYFIPKSDEIVQKYFKDPSIPSIAQLEKNTSLLLLQTHVSFGYPRPHLPNVIETGGMQIQDPKPLPKDLQKYLDESEDGIILFSMGTLARSSDFPKVMLEAFLGTFSKLKQRILWKWDADDIQGKSANINLVKWLPQADVLAHKNIKLFISHGGLQSTIEATSRGVPIVGIPLGADQKYNIQRAAALGYCIPLDLDNVTATSVEWAVTEMLSNPRYRETAQRRARLFYDRPKPPAQTAADWTEYVLRYRGAPHMRSAALQLAWYQRWLLDVAAVAALAAAATLLAVGAAVKTVLRLLFSPNKQVKSLKKE